VAETARPAIWRWRSVSMRSGNRLLMVTLSGTTSRDTAFMTPVRPALAATDGVISGLGDLTMALVMFTIRPKCRALMSGRTAWTISMAASMLACRAASHPAAVTSPNEAGGGPALLVTTMSGDPQAARRCRRPSGTSRSAPTPTARTPNRPATSSATRCDSSASRLLTTTETPSRARDSTQARPRPRVDAQTRAVRPVMPSSMSTTDGLPGPGQVLDVGG
jgi:hypothetical protein